MDPRFFTNKDSQASSPDSLDTYGSDQDRWQLFSTETINELTQLLLKFPNEKANIDNIIYPTAYPIKEMLNTGVGCAYLFLAEKRMKIANELKHGKESGQDKEDITDWYGAFRDSDWNPFETLTTSPKDQNWQHQKEAIFKLVDELANQSLDENREASKNFFTVNITTDSARNFYSQFDRKYYTASTQSFYFKILSPIKPSEISEQAHTQNLISINLNNYIDMDGKTIIKNVVIFYPKIEFQNLLGDFKIAEQYFNACRESKTIDELLLNLGKLSHLLGQLLLVKRGNSAIVEWMVRALAKEKGYDLGPFNFKDKIAWDMKAFVTPDRDKYAEWYQKNAFSEVKKLESGSSLKK